MADSGRRSSRMDADSDSESAKSAQSCISNEEDFEQDDDEVDYLALEVVNYLPADKGAKLLSNIRAKERAIQDLLKRNRSLLDTCDKLDQENQSTSERCEELARRAEAAEAAAARTVPPASSVGKAPASPVGPSPAQEPKSPAPKVNTSYFEKMEQGKEEKILRLTAENQRLNQMNIRCQDQVAQMDARMQELLKESKQLKKKFQEQHEKSQALEAAPSAPSAAAVRSTGCPELDEEERLYQDAQDNARNDQIARRMWAQMAEQRKKLAQMLEQVLSRDVLGAVCGWDSELSALDMQVEGLEKSLGSVGKGLRAPAANQASEQPAAPAEKGKKKQPGKKGDEPRLDSGWVDETGAQLLDHFDAMRSNLDAVDAARHTLEEACQRLGSDSTAAELADAVDCESTLKGAEAEAEWICEHNAAWVEKATRLGLGELTTVVERVEAAAFNLQMSAPPGILPPGVLEHMGVNLEQLGTLNGQLAEKTLALEELQADSVTVGRRVRALQGEIKTHKTLLRERVLRGITGELQPVSDAEAHLADALRRQRGVVDRARKEASTFFEDFSAALKRAGGSLSSSAGASTEATAGASVLAARESFAEAQRNAKEIRAALAGLRAALGRIHRELSDKMSGVLNAVAGEAEPQQQSSGNSGAKEALEAESKGKKGKKKKGKAGAKEDAPQSEAVEAEASHKAQSSVPEPQAKGGTKGTKAAAKPSAAHADKSTSADQSNKAAGDEDAALRAELASEFAKEGKQPKKKLTGKDLLKQLKDLKSASDSLEERIAARVARKASDTPADAAEDGPPSKEAHQEAPQNTTVKSTLRKKKVLYA